MSYSSSLTGKLLFWATVITAATLIAVVGASTVVARRVLQRQILRSAEAAAEDVALELFAAADPAELIQEPFWTNKLLRRLSLRSGLRGIEIAVSSGGRTSTLQATAVDAQTAPLIDFNEVELGQLMARSSDEFIEVVVRQGLRNGELSIRVSASSQVIGTFLRVVYRNAIWMGLAAWLILVVIIALLIHRTVTRPLRNVAAAMGAVGEGQLRQRVEASGTAEVEPLITAFNRMSERLAVTERERRELLEKVELLNRHLQRRVEEATAALASAQADLARRDRLAALGELVGTIAHEVGTPLNSVLAHLDLLGEDLPEGPNSQRLEEAMGEIERVSDIIRRYLETTRAPSPRTRRLLVGSLLREAIRIFESQAASNDVSLLVEAEDAEFRTDPDLLAQIVRNLVSNSLAAVSKGGRVMVSAVVEGDELRLEVVDNGIGMDAETRARIFEPFFSARPDGSGTGLGMSIVRNAVTSLGGECTVEATPGEGARVCVRIGGERGAATGAMGPGLSLREPGGKA